MIQLTRQAVAEISLVGMGLDLLGGCYLSYDLLGGKRGPLRMLARTVGYIALFFFGYGLVLGLRYGIVASIGMGFLLAVELQRIGPDPNERRERRAVILSFGFLRGLVLGLAGMTIAGPAFGAVFGVLAGLGLSLFYSLGLAPTDDYDGEVRPHLTRHRALATLSRMVAVSVAGLLAGWMTHPVEGWVWFGLKLGGGAGAVSALLGLFSPMIEWRIENLPDRRLGVAGLAMIAAGMILQSIQYWAVVFDWRVR